MRNSEWGREPVGEFELGIIPSPLGELFVGVVGAPGGRVMFWPWEFRRSWRGSEREGLTASGGDFRFSVASEQLVLDRACAFLSVPEPLLFLGEVSRQEGRVAEDEFDGPLGEASLPIGALSRQPLG